MCVFLKIGQIFKIVMAKSLHSRNFNLLVSVAMQARSQKILHILHLLQ